MTVLDIFDNYSLMSAPQTKIAHFYRKQRNENLLNRTEAKKPYNVFGRTIEILLRGGMVVLLVKGKHKNVWEATDKITRNNVSVTMQPLLV